MPKPLSMILLYFTCTGEENQAYLYIQAILGLNPRPDRQTVRGLPKHHFLQLNVKSSWVAHKGPYKGSTQWDMWHQTNSGLRGCTPRLSFVGMH